jgi:hypothetical protein
VSPGPAPAAPDAAPVAAPAAAPDAGAPAVVVEERKTGMVVVSADAPGARATLDGKPIETGLPVETTVGEHEVEVSAPGKITVTKKVVVAAGKTHGVKVHLKRDRNAGKTVKDPPPVVEEKKDPPPVVEVKRDPPPVVEEKKDPPPRKDPQDDNATMDPFGKKKKKTTP